MKHFASVCIFLLSLAVTGPLQAADQPALTQVSDNVYVLVGELGNRNPQNLGNNANLGVIITTKGVVVVDPGGSYRGAQHLHTLIKRVTDQPVVTVINTGGQDHRWLGNGYFKQQGATIIASADAVADHRARQRDQLFMLNNLVGVEGVKGTEPVYADKTFDTSMKLKVGDTDIEIHHVGKAHTPGDSFVWLPKQRIMFTGDIVYTERMLGVIEVSGSKSWLTVFNKMASYQPKIIIPGHGHPTDLARAKADTYDYLVFLREAVAQFMDNGGDISDIRKVDQSRFKHLLNFEILAGRNAQRVYSELEWE